MACTTGRPDRAATYSELPHSECFKFGLPSNSLCLPTLFVLYNEFLDVAITITSVLNESVATNKEPTEGRKFRVSRREAAGTQSVV